MELRPSERLLEVADESWALINKLIRVRANYLAYQDVGGLELVSRLLREALERMEG